MRTSEHVKRDLEITARLRGLTVSSLLNSLAVKAIREEKQIEPSAFPDGDGRGKKKRRKSPALIDSFKIK